MDAQKGLLIYPHEISADWNRLILDAGIDVVGIHPVGGQTFGRSIDEAAEILSRPETRRLLDELIAHGVGIEYEMHALSWLLPRSLFDDRPVWFRLDEHGVRVADGNFCFANDDALEYISRRAAELARLFASTTGRYFFWLDDMTGLACHCDRCREHSLSDAAFRTYRAILRGIREVDSGARHCFLAYQDTLSAPQSSPPDDGIFLEFAPIYRDPARWIGDPDCEKNRGEIRNLDELLAFFGRRDARALEYWLDNSLRSGWKLPPKRFVLDAENLRKDAAFYRGKGFETLTSFACYLGDDYRALYHESPDIAQYAACLRG